MRNLFKYLLLLLIIKVTLGCDQADDLTDSEKQARAKNAVNVSGVYVASSSARGDRLIVENEYYHHDVKMTLQLRSGIGVALREEITSFVRQNVLRVSAQEIDALIADLEQELSDFEYGLGANFAERGGENVALDAAGETSEIVVTSQWFEFHSVSEYGETYSFCLTTYMTAYKDKGVLDYRVTSNTDVQGKYGSRKGFKINMRINSGQEQRHSSGMFLALSEFEKVGG